MFLPDFIDKIPYEAPEGFNSLTIKFHSMKQSKIAAMMLAAASAFTPIVGAQELGSTVTKATHPEWVESAVIYEANVRQGTQGRTLKSLGDELSRLKQLGIDIVWLMPIHPISELNRKGTLGSYYAVRDYKDVNPEFGTIDDLKDFVSRAHALGIRVILDEVCNHTGCDNPWVKEHPDFYARNDKGEMFGPFDWTDTYKLDYSNPAMRAAMIDALTFWVKDCDIDGYRCDVAMEVPTDFWEEARTAISKYKDIFMLAEAAKPELCAAAFDADYAWPMKDVFNAIAATKGANKYAVEHQQKLPVMNALAIDSLLQAQELSYPQGSIRMNMVTNHDLNSWEGTEFERYGDGLGAFAVLSYTLPGMPMMYTGQEVGFNHALEFFEHDITPDYKANEFTTFYTMLNALKHRHPALRAGARGGKMVRHMTASPDIYAFTRQLPDDEVTVILNLSGEEQPLTWTGSAPALEGKADYFTSSDATLPATLKPWQYLVLTKK